MNIMKSEIILLKFMMEEIDINKMKWEKKIFERWDICIVKRYIAINNEYNEMWNYLIKLHDGEMAMMKCGNIWYMQGLRDT